MIRKMASVFVLASSIGAQALLFPRVAWAEPSPPEIANARRLFTEATELRSAGKWAEAAGKLRDAIAIKETAGLRFHLAHCEEQDGQLVSALHDYDRADELIREGMKADDVAALLAPARAALTERVPSLVVKIPADAEKAAVSIDGTPLGAAAIGKPMSLDPGSHKVEATALHRTPFLLEVRLVEGEDRVVEATLPRPAPSKPSVAAPLPASHLETSAPGESSSSFGLREAVLIGESAMAVGGVAVGVVFLSKRGEANDRIAATDNAIGPNDSCAPPRTDLAAVCTSLQSALDERRKDGTIATIGFIGGGVGLAAAAFTWFLWPTGRDGLSLGVAPVLGGAVAHGTF